MKWTLDLNGVVGSLLMILSIWSSDPARIVGYSLLAGALFIASAIERGSGG